jgi:hypothetical protein
MYAKGKLFKARNFLERPSFITPDRTNRKGGDANCKYSRPVLAFFISALVSFEYYVCATSLGPSTHAESFFAAVIFISLIFSGTAHTYTGVLHAIKISPAAHSMRRGWCAKLLGFVCMHVFARERARQGLMFGLVGVSLFFYPNVYINC